MKNYLRSFATKEAARQFASVGLIGVFNTVVDFGAFNVLRSVSIPRNWAIVLAFSFATFISYLLNRRWTFRIRSGSLSFLARCEMVLNNTAWKKISDSCPYTSDERASEPATAAAETQMCEPARWLGKTGPMQSPVRVTRVSNAMATE